MRLLDYCRPLPPVRKRPDLRDWHRHDLAAVWLGHATVLLRIGGMTILTDPVFSARVGVGFGLCTAGPRRLVGLPLQVHELPPIDLILISHAHFDHLDRPSLVRLPKRIPVVTATGTSDLIRDLGFRRVTELAWGQSTLIGGVDVTAREVRHWGARTFYDLHRGFNGYLIGAVEGGRRVLYGADTAYTPAFRDLGAAGGVDLAVFGIAAYDPYVAAHATPEQAWSMTRDAGARHVLPMHHATYRLSREPLEEPMERLLAAAGPDADRIVVREVGGQWAAARSTPADATVKQPSKFAG